MPDFLKGPFVTGPTAGSVEVLIRLLVALVLGGVVAWVYRKTRSANEVTASFPPTLVLLSVLIAMVSQVIGTNVALAFSLVGALSIVRFRTVVRDTQDTTFVICSVVVGMAVGVGSVLVALAGIGVVSLGAFVMKSRANGSPDAGALDFMLRVRVGLGADLKSVVASVLDSHVSSRSLVSMETAKQGISIDVTYDIQLRSPDGAEALVRSLNKIEGVQDVRLERREIVPE
jgi:Domain of unknown function (DUF4956)